jgi:hypothetical protein
MAGDGNGYVCAYKVVWAAFHAPIETQNRPPFRGRTKSSVEAIIDKKVELSTTTTGPELAIPMLCKSSLLQNDCGN